VLRRAAPVLRYATVGLVGVLAVAVLMNIVSRAATQDARATGGAAGATAVATDHGAHATSGVAEPSPVASPSEVAQPSPTFAPIGETRLAIVNRVVDGESLIVDIDGEEFPLRYIGIEAPDPTSSDPTDRQLAAAATTTNASLVAAQEVYLEEDVSETDEQGRLLRHVWFVDSDSIWKLASEQLVRRGYARVATVGPDQKYADALTAAQEEAAARQLGLWEGTPVESGESPAAPSGSVGAAECHPSYTPCVPVVEDLDCADIRLMGLAPVDVKGPDEYRLDPDGDGVGCPTS
jgi:micrococcal nuclease